LTLTFTSVVAYMQLQNWLHFYYYSYKSKFLDKSRFILRSSTQNDSRNSYKTSVRLSVRLSVWSLSVPFDSAFVSMALHLAI